MSICCGGNNCSKKEQCKNYVNNYFDYHPNEIAQFIDWSSHGFGYIGTDGMAHGSWDCGDLSDDYKFFKEIKEEQK